MPKKDSSLKLNRRKFLAAAAVAGATGAVSPPGRDRGGDRSGDCRRRCRRTPMSPPPRPARRRCRSRDNGTPGSDFMVDVIKTLDIKYLPANPASSYRGIHESLINYGKNTMPEFLTCTHEESGVGMCHGYFKATGKPLMTLVHGTVGLQHATMAVYNAWCDRVPVLIIGGNDLDAAHRPPGVPTFHSAQDINAIVRDYTKWDDTPVSPQHFAQSFVRMYKIATTPPYGPVMMALDGGLQTEPIREDGEKLYIPKFYPAAPPQGDPGAVKEAARLLANAERPVIVVDRVARTPNGVKLLVELRRAVAGAGGRSGQPDELPEYALSRSPGERDQQSRRHYRHGAVGLLEHGERLRRQWLRGHRPEHHQDQAGAPS